MTQSDFIDACEHANREILRDFDYESVELVRQGLLTIAQQDLGLSEDAALQLVSKHAWPVVSRAMFLQPKTRQFKTTLGD